MNNNQDNGNNRMMEGARTKRHRPLLPPSNKMEMHKPRVPLLLPPSSSSFSSRSSSSSSTSSFSSSSSTSCKPKVSVLCMQPPNPPSPSSSFSFPILPPSTTSSCSLVSSQDHKMGPSPPPPVSPSHHPHQLPQLATHSVTNLVPSPSLTSCHSCHSHDSSLRPFPLVHSCTDSHLGRFSCQSTLTPSTSTSPSSMSPGWTSPSLPSSSSTCSSSLPPSTRPFMFPHPSLIPFPASSTSSRIKWPPPTFVYNKEGISLHPSRQKRTHSIDSAHQIESCKQSEGSTKRSTSREESSYPIESDRVAPLPFTPSDNSFPSTLSHNPKQNRTSLLFKVNSLRKMFPKRSSSALSLGSSPSSSTPPVSVSLFSRPSPPSIPEGASSSSSPSSSPSPFPLCSPKMGVAHSAELQVTGTNKKKGSSDVAPIQREPKDMDRKGNQSGRVTQMGMDPFPESPSPQCVSPMKGSFSVNDMDLLLQPPTPSVSVRRKVSSLGASSCWKKYQRRSFPCHILEEEENTDPALYSEVNQTGDLRDKRAHSNHNVCSTLDESASSNDPAHHVSNLNNTMPNWKEGPRGIKDHLVLMRVANHLKKSRSNFEIGPSLSSRQTMTDSLNFSCSVRRKLSLEGLIDEVRKIPQRLHNNPFMASDGDDDVVDQDALIHSNELFCCLCLDGGPANTFTTLSSCGCFFCTMCLTSYVSVSIQGNINVPFLSCPDDCCPMGRKLSRTSSFILRLQDQGKKKSFLTRVKASFRRSMRRNMGPKKVIDDKPVDLILNRLTRAEIESLVDEKTIELYDKLMLEHAIETDPNKTFCPSPNCGSVCTVTHPSVTTTQGHNVRTTSMSSFSPATASALIGVNVSPRTKSVSSPPLKASFHCATCDITFCHSCRNPVHDTDPCPKSMHSVTLDPLDLGASYANGSIKRCPRCSVWIERDDGCAQMRCQRCHHVFCWYCLQSLQDDFLLRHYDQGPCKNKLGHSRASVLWHRTQVVAIFAGFGILMIMMSPIILLATPCFMCCNGCCWKECTKWFDRELYGDEASNPRIRRQEGEDGYESYDSDEEEELNVRIVG